jgi:N-acetylglucosaminyl-diphospho-decaprenol L-rhamnosyltransferase
MDSTSHNLSAEMAEQAEALVIRRNRNEVYGRTMDEGLSAAKTPLMGLANPDFSSDLDVWRRCFWQQNAMRIAPSAVPVCLTELAASSSRTDTSSPPSAQRNRPEVDAPERLLRRAPLRPMLARPQGNHSRARRVRSGDLSLLPDDDLCRRVIEAGHSLIHVHDAVVRHVRRALRRRLRAASSGQGFIRSIRGPMSRRNGEFETILGHERSPRI